MTTDLIGHASGFEILFFASAVIGTLFSQRNMRESWKDYRALGGVVNGRRAIAVGSIIVETILLSIHALFILAALLAMGRPASGDGSTGRVVIQLILVYAAWGLTGVSFTSRRVRVYLTSNGLQPRDDKGRFTR